jgi:hypothetical protein
MYGRRSPISDLEQLADYHDKVIQQAKATGRSSVLPQRVQVTQTLTVHADAVPAGKILRAWIPYPRAIAGQQQDIRFVSSQPSVHPSGPKQPVQNLRISPLMSFDKA